MTIDRTAVLSWYQRNRDRSRALFDMLPEDVYYERPIDLRHPVVFYDGHLPGFSFNTLVKKALGGPSIDERERQGESEHAGPRDTHGPPQELRRSVFRMRLCHLVQTPLPRFWSCRLHSKVGCRRLRPHTPHPAKEHLACHSRRAPSRRNHSAESDVSRRVPSTVKQGVRKQTHATAQILSG